MEAFVVGAIIGICLASCWAGDGVGRWARKIFTRAVWNVKGGGYDRVHHGPGGTGIGKG